MKLFTLKNMRHMPLWLARLLAWLVKLTALTYRVTVVDDEGWLKTCQPWPVIVTLWHNRILFTAALVPRVILERMTVLISNSRDGEYVSTFIRFFGLGVIRGSSRRGAVHALMGLEGELREGRAVILTIDGPRGPKYSVQSGVWYLSTHHDAMLLPVSVNAKHRWTLRSWDRTQIPYPFSRVVLRVGKPYRAPKEREAAAKEISARMSEITED